MNCARGMRGPGYYMGPGITWSTATWSPGLHGSEPSPHVSGTPPDVHGPGSPAPRLHGLGYLAHMHGPHP